MKWKNIPSEDMEYQSEYLNSFDDSEAWSEYLVEMYGAGAAMAFAEGSKRFYRLVSEDMERLSHLPKDACIWDLNATGLLKILPKQFRPNYNFEFLSHMRDVLADMVEATKTGEPMIAHTVLQELILYLCNNEAMKSPEVVDACDGDPEEWFGKCWMTWISSPICFPV